MPCKDNQKYNSDKENQSSNRMERTYHNSESFLYRYRWWIVLILALLLGYYLYAKRQETVGEQTTTTTTARPIETHGGTINSKLGTLNIASPAPVNLPTEDRKLFRL